MMDVKITAETFSWTDKLADTAIEDFESYQKDMSYGASTSIGLALAKLKMIEEGYLVELPCKHGDIVYFIKKQICFGRKTYTRKNIRSKTYERWKSCIHRSNAKHR